MIVDTSKLIEILKHSCLTLKYACKSCGHTEDDLSVEELDQIYSEIFECACCGWWYETSEANDVAGEFLCNDCNAEENMINERMFAEKSWQACQSLNDKRIEQLLAVIAKKDDALSAVDDLIEHQYCGSKDAMTDLQIACDMTHEALALQPSDVELVEVGIYEGDISDGEGAFEYKCYQSNLPLEPSVILYTIKTKANTK